MHQRDLIRRGEHGGSSRHKAATSHDVLCNIQRCQHQSRNRRVLRVSNVSRGLLRRSGLGVTSCAGVRRRPAFWGCDLLVHRYRGFDPSVMLDGPDCCRADKRATASGFRKIASFHREGGRWQGSRLIPCP
jgi:hypothetical protein